MKKHSIFLYGLLGALIGTGFSDIDSTLPFLLHRSIVTHAVFFPLIAWFISLKLSHAPLRLFSLGFLMAMAVHLSFDLFPSGWYGFANIHIPFFGRVPGYLSFTWIAVNMLVAAYLSLWLVWKMRDMILAAASALLPFLLYGSKEDFLMPLIAFVLAVGLTFWLSEQEFAIKTRVETWLNIEKNAEDLPDAEENATV